MPTASVPPNPNDAPDDEPPDISVHWPEQLARVRRSQARTDVAGMIRPPRDPDERAFLAARGQLGPFAERANAERPNAERPGEP